MRSGREILVLIAVLFSAVGGSHSARAACGLSGCPIDAKRNDRPERMLGAANVMTLVGAVTESGESAHYVTTSISSEVFPTAWLRFSFQLPISTVFEEGSTKSGLSDLVLETAFAPAHWDEGKSMFWLGHQFDLPTGSESDHLGSGHAEYLPYVSIHFGLDRSVAYLKTGTRLSLSGHAEEEVEEHHGFHGSVIDPHDRYEAVYRTGLLYKASPNWSAEVALAGQTVLSGENAGQTYLSIVPQLNFPLLRELEVHVQGQAPIGPSERFDWRVGAGVQMMF